MAEPPPLTAKAEGLPAYEPSDNAPVLDMLGPATLCIVGRFIFPGDPSAPPLYEFSHSLGYLTDTDRSVKLERIDHTVKSSVSNPHTTTRNRHLYDLKHPTPGEWPTFGYHAEAVSRRALCTLGISTFRSSRLLSRSGNKGYRFHRAVRPANRSLEAKEVVFEAVRSKDKSVGHEWRDGTGRLIAREVDDEEETMSLVVGSEMSVAERDALVAAWVLRIWFDLGNGHYRSKRWGEMKRIAASTYPGVSDVSGFRHI